MTAVPDTAPTETMSMVAALNSALDLALAGDERVVLLGEDIADPAGGVLKVTKGLSTRYGTHRVRATPIAEQAIVGAAIGLALGGYRPVAEVMFMDFTAVCLDQIVNHAAKLRYMSGGKTPVPLTIRTSVGTRRFGAQHSQSLEAWFMHTPGMKVIVPSTPADAKGLLAAAIADDDPCLFVEHLDLAFTQKGEVPTGVHLIPLGVAEVKRPGDDVTVVTYGPPVHRALAAAGRLAERGISAEVIDLRTLVPLDVDTVLASVARTGRAVVVHDAHTFCGPGAELAAQITERLWGELHRPVVRLGAGWSPVPFAAGLDFHPTEDQIIEAVTSLT